MCVFLALKACKLCEASSVQPVFLHSKNTFLRSLSWTAAVTRLKCLGQACYENLVSYEDTVLFNCSLSLQEDPALKMFIFGNRYLFCLIFVLTYLLTSVVFDVVTLCSMGLKHILTVAVISVMDFDVFVKLTVQMLETHKK